ncbi:ASCH domain-containing protein [Granulosicoccus sp. 3-233]|uniref:ASCH domain-containing protein n=1 Tax=Granulosicoccus sp. 3-233 TaxID=3417969 RepID=UPI003D33E4E3
MKLEDLKKKYPEAATFKFGDGAPLCALLIRLVREGKKTATCGALHDFTDDGDEMPVVGRCDIALNWDGTPELVLRTVAVEIKRYCDVDEEFALLEGENDSLEGWRSDHRDFFERNGGFDEEMLLVCERFEVVEDVKAGQ